MSDHEESPQAQFDEWAATYDHDVRAGSEGFPFAGYTDNLRLIVAHAAPRAGMTVLDLGVGTGNLARPFLAAGANVLGVDFSPAMLARARAALPTLQTAQVDLSAERWPAALNRRFDLIVSNYVFHEFPLDTKLRLLQRLAAEHLAGDGRILIGDIIFPDGAALDRARRDYADTWDEEHYWLLDETASALAARGWALTFLPTSFCAGVLLLRSPLP